MEKKKTWTRQLGKFEVTGDRLMVSDPCYSRGTWCQGVVEDALPGKWAAHCLLTDDTHGWGTRVTELWVRHEGSLVATNWEKLDIDVGVDSGQCGVFDESRYPQGDCGDYGDKGTFYGRACEATSEHGGVILEGAVSCSGYGDGGYNAYVQRDADGKVCAAKVVFIGDDDDDEDEGLHSGDYETD